MESSPPFVREKDQTSLDQASLFPFGRLKAGREVLGKEEEREEKQADGEKKEEMVVGLVEERARKEGAEKNESVECFGCLERMQNRKKEKKKRRKADNLLSLL